jgi:hypothetical protein
MRRILLTFALMIVAVSPLAAQRRSRVGILGNPSIWLSGGISGFMANQVNDGGSGSNWNFGNSTNLQYNASLERAIGSTLSFGVAGSFASVPFLYSSPQFVPVQAGTTSCGSCDAHLDMTTLVATLHAGGTTGLYQVIALNGGIVMYNNLRRDSDKAKLAPGGGNIDPYFSLGYGIGYGVNKTTQIEFVPEAGISIHEHNGLSNGVSNTNSTRSLRLAVRMGF